MSKYNFELDLDSENSLSTIINMIKPKSKVLEFGPANGRMTKYLSENLNCSIDIVEIDESAGREALQYSNKSFVGEDLGDIEKYKWLEELKNERYDYIVFGDVLEHLYFPSKALKLCNRILKDSGSIIISAPNIAHNSVIIDLINDEFKYNEVGLLDNTHISFFSYKSLIRMIEGSGYKTVIEKATHCRVGENEIDNNYNCVSKECAKSLRKRDKGNLYQFVFEVKKKEYVMTCFPLRQVNLDMNYEYEFTCYIKEQTDDNYSEIKKISKFINPSHNIIELQFSEFKEICQLRLDPIENNCIIDIKKIYTIIDDKKVDINILYTTGINLARSIYIFSTNDPQIYLDVKGMNIKVLYYEYTFIDYDSDNISKYEQLLKNIIEDRNLNIKQKENTIWDKENTISEKENIIRDKENTINEKENKIIEKQNIIIEKDKLTQELNSIIENYKFNYIEAIAQRDEINIKLSHIETSYNIIANSTSWKITKPIRVVLDFIKKNLKSNRYTHKFCKGLKCLKQNGIKYTLKKIKLKSKSAKGYKDYARLNILTDEEKKIQINTKFTKNIKFSIVVPLYNTPENFLCEMINSCIDQTYNNWELCLADGSDKEHGYVKKIILDYTKKDKRIKYKVLNKNLGISENTNESIKMATGEYIALFDHDDILHSSALFEYMKAICEKNADFIYCDEDKFETDINLCFDPYYKPDFAIDNLRANNYICHFTVFKRNLLDEVGLFRKEFDGSQDHDMVLRLTQKANHIVHVPKILYHWRVSSNSVASDPYAKPYTIQAGIDAVKAHLERCDLKAIVESSVVHPNIYRIKYKIIGNPLISILIPNKDHVVDLSKCINSILKKSIYKNIEIIIIENNSTKLETFEYYKTLEQYQNIKVVIYESKGKFNYSAINNFGVAHAKGEHLLFLNNDIEIISENWLQEMLMYSQREDVGAVGVKLYYSNDTIQHAGLGIGILTLAGHYFRSFDRNASGYMGNLFFVRNVSGVTAACLMMKKSIFNEINGFDETFEVAFNDVDLCMRIRKSGYLIVWTPYAEAYHYESISRGNEDTPEKQARFNGEVARFKNRWKEELQKGDPYYNINLTLDREDFSLR
ncbi:glycosyltransferase [Clostridium tagluense]|uniref:glycosyltransferase n=1 Tax=Clostridium tagluense TaxID=360422 RepID=UPI001CF10498|nr:glycosyltransferase [Clostridium tagluense]MCB2312010.1 glycosyltransferase [Clostridium tagluense]MCB2316597.1 glycosyltransferase [Clostridium tagluense]MCB2321467.1 glycosyltransferase [Clostridium tagluense]MCB2326479.1 glycosyltransferase [Clostridium tagluense]MCB2331189.1 glycosyltransferase [Clostridium tagluense]